MKAVLIFLFFVSYGSLVFAEKSITLQTYYPAPQGAYNSMRSKKMCVGAQCFAATSPYQIANDELIVEGNVGIGTDDPQAKLHIVGGNLLVDQAIESSSFVGGTFSGSSATFTGDVSGASFSGVNAVLTSKVSSITMEAVNFKGTITPSNASFSGTSFLGGSFQGTQFLYVSDQQLKEKITDLEDSLKKVLALRGVSFYFKAQPDIKKIGLIAQEVEKVVPEVIAVNQEGIKAVEYGNLIALLIEAIKQQQQEIDILKSKLP